MNKATALRIGVGVAGLAVLSTIGVTAVATAAEYGEDDVTVSVEIEPTVEPGVLALTVAGDSTTLLEDGSTETLRQFTGSLPQVSVSDTRTAEEIPEGAAWYVIGTTTAFVGTDGQDDIPAANLGWTPSIVGDDNDGTVFAGEPIEGELEGGDGLIDQDLLFTTVGSAENIGTWTATAALKLRTAVDVAPGSYASTITLSLFE